MSLLIIDNKDSFTYNLAELFRSIYKGEMKVIAYDQLETGDWQRHRYLVISPGPGLPGDFPKYNEWIGQLDHGQSLLGVCMGHEIIAQYFGGQLRKMQEVSHGMACKIIQTDAEENMFAGMNGQNEVGLYHSWVVSENGLPDCLQVTARDEKGLIMAMRHKSKNIRSVQFHPESYITKMGKTMMENWLNGS